MNGDYYGEKGKDHSLKLILWHDFSPFLFVRGATQWIRICTADKIFCIKKTQEVMLRKVKNVP